MSQSPEHRLLDQLRNEGRQNSPAFDEPLHTRTMIEARSAGVIADDRPAHLSRPLLGWSLAGLAALVAVGFAVWQLAWNTPQPSPAVALAWPSPFGAIDRKLDETRSLTPQVPIDQVANDLRGIASFLEDQFSSAGSIAPADSNPADAAKSRG